VEINATDAEWLMWLDCNAAFTNFNIDWKMDLDGYLDRLKVLLASKHMNGINFGVFLVPNTLYSRFFVDMMSEERHDVEHMGWFHKDQNALKNLLKKSS
jgi:hypothetical protein